MSSLSNRTNQNRNQIPAGSRKSIREHRRISEIQRLCAQETKTVARGENSEGETQYDVRVQPSRVNNQWSMDQAVSIVDDEMKRLSRKTKAVKVPDDYNSYGYGQAVAERLLQIYSQKLAQVGAI